ncbi:MAG: alpha/beta hydrolase [Chitinophagaceae bacterium]|nr:alpha/beta hydrolase [Chitinophagaceae bacterium]
MTSSAISISGATFSYFKTGNGFPLVFLHGFCEDHTIWNDFIIPFAEKYTVLLPDLPGFGKSGLPNQPCSIDSYADCIKAMLDAEKISSCAVIGHSLGGYVTMNFAERYGNCLSGFGLFHSFASEDDEAKKKDRERVANLVRTKGVTQFVNELYNNLFAEEFKTENEQKINALKKHGAETSTAEGVAQASLAMRNRRNTIEVLKQATVPVLFIIGKEDKAISPEKTLQQSHLPERSVISLLENVGHMGMVEAPEKCQLAISEWLSLIS